MSSFTGLSPNNPRDYVGPNVALNTVVTRKREPTGADYRQPETGKLYPFNTFWLVGKNPTTGIQGDLWYLSKIAANVAFWLKLSTSSFDPLIFIDVQASTPPGINPVSPTLAGVITINGEAVVNHAVPLETISRSLNALNLEVQYATTAATTTGNLSGVSHFNSNQFVTDANGFVSLIGGGRAIDTTGVDGFTVPGTNPVAPDNNGLVTVNGSQVASGTTANAIRTFSLSPNNYQIQVQRTSSAVSTNQALNGVSHFNSAQFSINANGFVSASATGIGQTITGDTGGALSPTAGNWNVTGGGPLSSGNNGSVSSGSGSNLTITSINCAKWIVDANPLRGTHTTIQAAINAATSGQTIFVRPGIYTENLALKSGVNIVSFVPEGDTPNVTVIGNSTHNTAGTVTISGLRLQTNSAPFLSVTGSAASIVFISHCFLNCTNNTGISYTTGNASSSITIKYCFGNIATSGIALYNMTSTGTLGMNACSFQNTGSTITAATNSAGNSLISHTNINFNLSTTSTGGLSLNQCGVNTQNATGILHNGIGACLLYATTIDSGTASAISVGTGASVRGSCITVISSNTNAITGIGTIVIAGIAFAGSSTLINTTTETLGAFNGGEYIGRKSSAVASLGMIGQTISGTAQDVALVSGVAITITSISLTPGAWIIRGTAFTFNTGVVVQHTSGISTTNNTMPAGVAGVNFSLMSPQGGTATGWATTQNMPGLTVNIAVTTTYFLVARATFSTLACSVNGRIDATRIA